jgi:hypothetical protein
MRGPDTALSPKTRRAIWERDGGICQLCRGPVAFGPKMDIDHIIAIRMGGTDDPSNLRTTHDVCNRTRGRDGDDSKSSPTPPAKTIRRHSNEFAMRFSATELALLDDAAAALGVTRIALIRMLIRNASFLTVSVPPRQPAGDAHERAPGEEPTDGW